MAITAMTPHNPHWKQRILKLLKTAYRQLKWRYLRIVSGGHVDNLRSIDPFAVAFGQTPESQFPPKQFLGGFKAGDWDKQVIPVESHLLYQSYLLHFTQGEPWESTPFFQFALESIKSGTPFRGEYDSLESLRKRFEKCDRLFESVKSDGYKSNHQLYDEGKLDSVLEKMDEITINISRDGSLILNDGWHRFATARLLNIQSLPVRICAQHAQLKKSSTTA